MQTTFGAVLTSISTINGYVTDPSVKGYLDAVDVPKSFTIALAVLGLITILAHGRAQD